MRNSLHKKSGSEVHFSQNKSDLAILRYVTRQTFLSNFVKSVYIKIINYNGSIFE